MSSIATCHSSSWCPSLRYCFISWGGEGEGERWWWGWGVVRVTVRWGGCEGESLYMYNTCKLPLRCFVRKTHRPTILHMHVIFNPCVCILYIICKQTKNAMYLTEWREIPSWVGSMLVLITLKSIGILRTYVGTYMDERTTSSDHNSPPTLQVLHFFSGWSNMTMSGCFLGRPFCLLAYSYNSTCRRGEPAHCAHNSTCRRGEPAHCAHNSTCRRGEPAHCAHTQQYMPERWTYSWRCVHLTVHTLTQEGEHTYIQERPEWIGRLLFNRYSAANKPQALHQYVIWTAVGCQKSKHLWYLSCVDFPRIVWESTSAELHLSIHVRTYIPQYTERWKVTQTHQWGSQ